MSNLMEGKYVREVPRHERHCNANGLFHRKHPPIWRAGNRNGPLNPLRLTRKPPRESQSVVQFALRLCERLAGLVGDDMGQIVSIFADQLVPFEETLGSDSRVDFLVGLEGRMCGFDGGIGVRGIAVRSRGPDFPTAWIVDIKAFTYRCLASETCCDSGSARHSVPT